MEFEFRQRITVQGDDVFIVKSPITFERDNNPMLGMKVTIDGITGVIDGVESNAIPEIKKGALIGVRLKGGE